MNEEIVKVLKAMRVKLAAGWTQEAAARTSCGIPVFSEDPEACSFCVMGALWSANSSLKDTVEDALMQTLRGIGFDLTLPTYNDTPGRTQAEILTLVDKTIERLEKTNEQE
jgi:hypothetical protein